MSDTSPNSVTLDGEEREGPDDSQVRMRNAEIFGDYELLGRIRLGGMAEVLKARRETHKDDFVAIKRVLPSFTDEEDYVSMFEDEVRLAQRFSHPNIVRAIEHSRVDDTPFLVMDYVRGQDAGQLVKRGARVPVPIVCEIGARICAALHYAHGLSEGGEPLGIVHRDVSPHNILIGYEGDVKLIDFGIAKSESQAVRTQAGMFKGKYGYFSPEQASTKPVDLRSDVFSLAVTLHELLSGQRLFKGSSDFSTLQRVRRAQVPNLSETRPEVPEALTELLARALSVDPAQRFQSAAEMGEALQDLVNAAELACDSAQIGAYMCETFAAEFEAEAAGEFPDEQQELPEDGTGLSAFEDLEPVSTVSELAVLPEPTAPGYNPVEELAAPAAPAAADPQDPQDIEEVEEVGEAGADDDEDIEEVQDIDVTSDRPPADGRIAAQAAAGTPGDARSRGLSMDWDEDEELATQNYDLDDIEQAAPSAVLAGPQPTTPLPAVVAAGAQTYPSAQPVVQPTVPAAPPAAPDRSVLFAVAAAAAVLVVAGAWWSQRPAATGTISLSSTPIDAEVVLDGDRRGSGSPFVLTEVTAGKSHELLVRRTGYKPWSTQLTVQAGQALQLPPVTLVPDGAAPPAPSVAGTAAPTVAPAVPTGAAAVPIGQAGQPAQPAQTVPAPQPARAAGPAKSTAAAAPQPTGRAASTPERAQSTRRVQPQQRAEAPARRPSTPAPTAGGGKGMLRINSRPWSQVFVDGRLVGNTPQMSLLLPAGKHSVRLMNPQFKLEKTITVKITRGGQVTRIVDLAK